MKINCYDIVVILDPKQSESNIKDLLTRVKKVISSMGGEILTEDNWGIKKFSHPIKNNKDGIYHFMKVKMDGSKNAELKHDIKVINGILRVSIIKSMIEVVK